MKHYILRNHYLKKLSALKEKNVIKVITGVRRSGKSVLMQQYQNELINSGVKAKQILSLNFEKLENEELLDYKKLHDYICQRLNPDGYSYIFLDEIQMVQGFQKTVDSLYTKENVDIYITGSNSYLLSGELATLLSGRYIPIHILPLSFSEYADAFLLKHNRVTLSNPYSIANDISGNSNKNLIINPQQLFSDYLKLGSFPQIVEFDSQQTSYEYLDSLYNTVIVKDICGREKTVDVGVLTSLTKFIFHNIGSLVSSTTIANTLTSNNRKTSYNTVEKYLNFLKDSYIIYEVGRYDVKGKQHLKQNAKYYAVDTGLRNMLLANKDTDIGHLLENTVFLELLRRGYKISVGKVDTKEIDFIAENENGIEYYQVAASVLDPATLAREIEPLNGIKDHFPKYILSLDNYTANLTHNGIRVVNAIDFFMQKF
ncbi:MAG: ATP-binding protein [Firmicutes bacterium]|nr:ATP-binding protein [Bacillota bacterium]